MRVPFSLRRISMAIAHALLLSGSALHAQWSTNVPQWSGFGDPGLYDRSLDASTDAQGNVFLVAVAGSTLGLQRWDVLGLPSWGSGLIVPDASVVNRDHVVVPDGEGGCYLAYVRSALPAGAYVQHLDANGSLMFPWPGQRVNTLASLFWADVWMVRDDSHLYLTFSSEAANGLGLAYGQKFDLALNRLWGDTGVVISADTSDHLNARCLPDGRGGLFALYRASFNASNTYMRMQHMDSLGVAQWGAGLKLHTTLPVGALGRAFLEQGAFGDLYACWDGGSNALQSGIYLSRVDTTGTLRWGNVPVVVSNANDIQDLPSLQVDANGDAYVAWRDLRALPAVQVRMQRVDTAGTLRWTPERTIEPDGLNTVFPKLVGEDGGIRLFWSAFLDGTYRILTQVLDSAASAQCTLPGETIGAPDHRLVLDDLLLEMPQGGYVLVVSTASFTSGAYVHYVEPQCGLNTATGELPGTEEVRLWPSPTADVLHVNAGMEVQHVTVTDLQGRPMGSALQNGGPMVEISLGALAPGMYLVWGDEVLLGRCIRQ
jgi:hypothetical protein